MTTETLKNIYKFSPQIMLHNRDYFKITEISDPLSINCGIANSEKDKLDRRMVVTERYLEKNYITDKDLCSDGTYYDKYENDSIPLIAKINNKVVASMRLIPNTEKWGLPINNEPTIKINGEWKNIIKEIPFELSQLAKSKESLHDHRPVLAIIRTYMQISKKMDINEAVGVIDSNVKEQLNGPFLGFNLPQIGLPVFYMGSISEPIYININNVINSSRKNKHDNLSYFLEGKRDVKGFEWYQGP